MRRSRSSRTPAIRGSATFDKPRRLTAVCDSPISWAPQANGVVGVRALVADPAAGTLAAGGDFTMIAGQTRKRDAFFR